MTHKTPPPRPLDGVKVLDLARVLSGPLCASMLADLGAEVTKVELPGQGDDSRAFSPHVDGQSSYFRLVNRSKKSVTINMKSAEGLGLVRRLIEKTDVLVENFRPGVTERLGIDYQSAKRINPRLVYVSISGFGQDGPLAHRAAYDHIVQAMGGIMSVTGWPGSQPTRVGDAIGDVVAGLYGAFGVLAALLQRQKTGEGQHVDVSMLDAVMSLQMVSLAQILGGGAPPGRLGNAHAISAPMDSFSASDGEVVIAVANDALFERLAAAIGRPDLAGDDRFASDPERLRHQAPLRQAIEAWTNGRTVVEIVDRLEAAGVPVAPIWDLSQAMESDHARHRRPAGSVLPQPVRMSGAPAEIDRAAPGLGAQTDSVLADELGLEASEIAALHQRGVI